MAANLLPLRPNVCMLVFNRVGDLFLGERLSEKEHWQFPQGGVEPGATLEHNVYRELREEIGILPSHIGTLTQLNATYEYEWHNPPAYSIGVWRGQAQTFWLVEFLGQDSDIRLDADDEQEFGQWCWCPPSLVKERAHPRRAKAYDEPLAEFCAFWAQRSG
jgi:putative (di)nucleoside polyphosphate hydrolase